MTLLKQIRIQIDNDIPDLVTKKIWWDNLTEPITKLNFKQLIILFLIPISIIFIYNYVDSNFLGFVEFNYDDVLKILTSSAITFVTLNLTITNLLLTHLKDDRDHFEHIIQKKVKYKFITYLGFSIIFYLVLLNIWGESIPQTKHDILLFLGYSFIYFILLIINLYNNVFTFILSNDRKKILNEELIKEIKIKLYTQKVKKDFNNSLDLFFEKKMFTKSSRFLIFEDQNHNKVHINFKSTKYLTDFKIDKAEKTLKRRANQKVYSYNIDSVFEMDNDYLFASSNEDISTIKELYIFKNKPNFKLTDDQIFKLFIKRLNKNIESGNIESLNDDFENINEIIELYIKTQI